jgi:hypothetical protein
MTAVDFLLSHMWTTDWVNYSKEEKLEVIEKAKELEKQQIIDTVLSCASFIGYEEAEQFYNKTFKK